MKRRNEKVIKASATPKIHWPDYYENGRCPDCYRKIPVKVSEGASCTNCGHIFWIYRPDDTFRADGTRSDD